MESERAVAAKPADLLCPSVCHSFDRPLPRARSCSGCVAHLLLFLAGGAAAAYQKLLLFLA